MLVAFLLAGCPVKPSGIPYQNAPQPILSDAQGALFILHNGSAGGTSRIGFEVNGQEVISLADGEYTWIELPPGEYEVTNRTSFMNIDLSGRNPSSSTHIVEIRYGKSSYYNFSYTLQSMEPGMGVTFAGAVPVAYPEPIGYYQRNFELLDESQTKQLLMSGWLLYNPSRKFVATAVK